jgi:hypothetical protein
MTDSIVRETNRYDDSPIAWFAELIFARDVGDFRRAADAQSKLFELGWWVRYRRANSGRKGVGR